MISQEDHFPYIGEYSIAQDIATFLQEGYVWEYYKARICCMRELMHGRNVTNKQAGAYWR